MQIVDLTWPEMGLAWYVAGQRNLMNKMRKVDAKYGAAESDEMSHVAATRGELAVAKAFNLSWSGAVGDYKALDVGGMLEVRARTKPHYDLILHPHDRDGFPFILADVSAAPTIRLRGWIYGRDGKQKKYWLDPAGGRPAFFVPQSDLRPMPDLHSILATRVAA